MSSAGCGPRDPIKRVVSLCAGGFTFYLCAKGSPDMIIRNDKTNSQKKRDTFPENLKAQLISQLFVFSPSLFSIFLEQ